MFIGCAEFQNFYIFDFLLAAIVSGHGKRHHQ